MSNPIAKRPAPHTGWRPAGTFLREGRFPIQRWKGHGLLVLSECAVMNLPADESRTGWQWLVSVSRNGRRRPRAMDVGRVRRDFGMTEAEADNHEPGCAQKLFLVVDIADRVTCQCKVEELLVREPDGYEWTTPVDGPCRGCEHERRTGRPCPIHTLGTATIIRQGP